MPLALDITPDHRIAFRENLLAWYDAEQRDLPWRKTDDPYRIWLSEVMLQQTRVDQATPYYRRFVERFPSVEALAGSDLDDVLLCWEGLGYYSRARNLHKAAQKVVEEFGGRIPDSDHDIRSLPGVGSYTAAAVLSIAYDKPHAVLDGNVARVLSRIFAVASAVNKTSTRRALTSAAGELLDPSRPGAFNQALMELGARVCTPAAPACPRCPVRMVCSGCENPEAFPVVEKSRPIPHHDIAVALLRDESDRVLIQKRREDGMLGGLWEFPGGKREPEECLEDACRRELNEELGVEISVDSFFGRVSHAYSHFRITLHAFRARIVAGEPSSTEGLPLRWVALDDLGGYAFPRANRRLIERLSAAKQPPAH